MAQTITGSVDSNVYHTSETHLIAHALYPLVFRWALIDVVLVNELNMILVRSHTSKAPETIYTIVTILLSG